MSTWRGHEVVEIKQPADVDVDVWVYVDSGVRVDEAPDRACGHCTLPNSPEGHDGCLGTLSGGVINACCGHGVQGDAYVQFEDGRRIEGSEAMAEFQRLSN